MGRDPGRKSRPGEDGRDQRQHQRNVVRVERIDRKRPGRILPHPGADGHHRIRAARLRQSPDAHPHDVPRPDERLWHQMVEAVRATSGRLLMVIAAVLALLPSLVAHRLDEYLQATVAMIEPDRIRLRIKLTPGVDVADQVLAKIDLNRDAIISANEAATYAESLRRDLVVRLDQSDAGLEVAALSFAEADELRPGRGTSQIEFAV